MKSSLIQQWIQPFSLYILNKTKFMDKMPTAVTRLHLKMVALHGRHATIELTRQFMAQMLTSALIMLVLCGFLALFSEDKLLLLVAGLPLTVLFPFLQVKALDKQIEQRKRSIIIELPEFLSKLTLLVNAGDTVQGALGKCIVSRQGAELTPLYKELTVLHNELKNNQSLAKSLEELSKRCAMAEVSQFTTTVLLNYRRGGEDFVLALRELTRVLWERRKALAKTLGEEASSKLVIPMVMTFMIVMIIVAAPAMLIMNF